MNTPIDAPDVESGVVSEFLHRLGFGDDAISVYIALVRNGPSTLYTLAKNSHTERTKLYRLTDELVAGGIIEEIPLYRHKTVKAVDINTIELLVNERVAQVSGVKQSLPVFSDAVRALASAAVPGVNVIHYRGVEGLRQMTWHTTRCRGLYRTYSYRFWNDIFGDAFTQRLNHEFTERKFRVHDLYSDQYLKYKKEWMKRVGKKPAGDWGFWKARYVPERIVAINQNIDIYNDTVAYSYWDGEDRFGVEIQNQRVADMQKQIHDLLWKMGKRIDTLDWRNPVW
jgi:hypothetical protein